MLIKLKAELKKLANPSKAKIYQRFFKTGKGEYAEGDIFLGITVPNSRKVAKRYLYLNFEEIEELLKSKIHEERFIALVILTNNYEKDISKRENIFNFYIKNIKYINNWDLVDVSAPRIVGHYLSEKNKNILYKLAISKNLWERRISIISTLYFIVKQKEFSNAIKISKLLMADKHDLIHKAVGWMLREVGKKDDGVLKDFLKENYKIMPRTMLRYAIEKFPEKLRKKYLNGEI